MNINYRLDKNIIYIELDGRVDASNSSVVEQNILKIKEQNFENRKGWSNTPTFLVIHLAQ